MVASSDLRCYGDPVLKSFPSLRRFVALFVALALLPGWVELVENIEHLVHDGHFAHSEAHELAQASEAPHEPIDEHGCTPVSHHCGCHTSVPGVIELPEATVLPRFVMSDAEPPVREGRLLERAQAPPLRPPIA